MDINLLPRTTSHGLASQLSGATRSSRRRVWVPRLVIFLVVALLVGGCQIWLLSKTRNLQERSDALTQKIAAAQTASSGLSSGTQTNSIAGLLKSQEALVIPWDTVMKDVSASVASSGVTVDTINGSASSLQLAGTSPGLAAMSLFEQSLGKYNWVSSVQFQGMNESSAQGSAIFQKTNRALIKHGNTGTYSYTLVVNLQAGSGEAE